MTDDTGQVDAVHGDLHFANTAKEICDQDTSRVPQEQVGAVAGRRHALTLGTHLELEKQRIAALRPFKCTATPGQQRTIHLHYIKLLSANHYTTDAFTEYN